MQWNVYTLSAEFGWAVMPLSLLILRPGSSMSSGPMSASVRNMQRYVRIQRERRMGFQAKYPELLFSCHSSWGDGQTALWLKSFCNMQCERFIVRTNIILTWSKNVFVSCSFSMALFYNENRGFWHLQSSLNMFSHYSKIKPIKLGAILKTKLNLAVQIITIFPSWEFWYLS